MMMMMTTMKLKADSSTPYTLMVLVRCGHSTRALLPQCRSQRIQYSTVQYSRETLHSHFHFLFLALSILSSLNSFLFIFIFIFISISISLIYTSKDAQSLKQDKYSFHLNT
jgi:hypothetical protein